MYGSFYGTMAYTLVFVQYFYLYKGGVAYTGLNLVLSSVTGQLAHDDLCAEVFLQDGWPRLACVISKSEVALSM